MLRLTITAAATGAVTIQDTFPAEGTFCITLDPAHTKTVDFTYAQYNHLKVKLDAMVAAGLITYTVVDTEEARSDELLELKERTAKVATLAVTGGTVPNLVTLGIRKGDVFNKYVAITGVTTAYTVDEVNSATCFTSLTTVVAFDILAAGDKIYFSRDGVLITSTDRTVAGAITHLIATVSQSTYQRSGFGRIYVKASDSRPYFMRDDGTEMSLGMLGSDPLVFKGVIAAPGDFPLAGVAQNGWLYRVTANVTDPVTAASFPAGSEIAWVGPPTSAWCELGDAPELRGKVFHVDGNRADSYVADGTLRYPYKTIAAAIAVPPVAGDTIVVAYKVAAPYAEAVVLPQGVSLEGISGNYTYIDGNITTGAFPCSIKYIVHSGAANVLEINGGTTMRDFFSYGRVSLPLATSKVQMWNCHINSTALVAVTLAHASAEFYSVMGKLSTTGDNYVIDTVGKVILDLVEVSSPAGATKEAIRSLTSGYLRLFNSSVVNLGAAAAITANNAAGAAAPNVLNGVIASSAGANAVAVGTAVTLFDNVQSLSGTLTGTQITTPHTQHYDSRQVAPADEEVRLFRTLSAGRLVSAAIECDVAPTGAEVLTFDIRVLHLAGGDHSLLTAAVQMTAATVPDVPIALTPDPAANSFVAGDLIYVRRSGYAAGGATLHDTTVDVEIQRNI